MAANPIGYVEVQRAWIEGEYPKFDDALSEKLAECHREGAGGSGAQMVYTGSRVEAQRDGAGVMHYTLYAGYAPKQLPGEVLSEPLNPRNLNDAPVNNIGDPARDNFIGMKEQRF